MTQFHLGSQPPSSTSWSEGTGLACMLPCSSACMAYAIWDSQSSEGPDAPNPARCLSGMKGGRAELSGKEGKPEGSLT